MTRVDERREVKDALAYLRVLANPSDLVNLRRILNVPKRGIGDRAKACVAALADRERIGFADALVRAREAPGIATRSVTCVQAFTDLLDALRAVVADGSGAGGGVGVHSGTDRLPRRAAGQPRPAARVPDREPR